MKKEFTWIKSAGRVILVIVNSFFFVALAGCNDVPHISDEIEQLYKPQEDSEETHWNETIDFVDNFLLHGDNFKEGDSWGVLLIQSGEDVIFHSAYGWACAQNNVPNTVDTPFQIASLTKKITGAAIMQLIADQRLNIDDTLDLFFYGHDGLSSVTVGHLLTMRAGFGCFIADTLGVNATRGSLVEERLEDPDVSVQLETATVCELIQHIIENWSGETIERGFDYSNSDYFLLGRIIEQVSGMSYEEFILANIFEPAGMINSGFGLAHDAATPHGTDGTALVRLPFAVSYSTGGIVSTASDLGLFLDAYFGGELFPDILLEQIYLGAGEYNMGWQFRSENIWWHPGGAPGSIGVAMIEIMMSD